MFAQVHSIILQTQRHNISIMYKNQCGFIAEIQEKWKHVSTQTRVHIVHSSIIHISPQMENTQMSINWWMGK